MRNNTGISKAQWRKDAPSLLLCCVFIAFIPIAVIWARPRPLAADSPGELISIEREQTQDEAASEMSRRYNGWNPQTNPDARWVEIEQTMYDAECEKIEIDGVLGAAKLSLSKENWPLYAKSAFLENQKVWLVASSQDAGSMNGMWICPPSSEDLHKEKMRRFISLMKIIVVTADAPYRVLTH